MSGLRWVGDMTASMGGAEGGWVG